MSISSGPSKAVNRMESGFWNSSVKVVKAIGFFPSLCFHISKTNTHLSYYTYPLLMIFHVKLNKERDFCLLCLLLNPAPRIVPGME